MGVDLSDMSEVVCLSVKVSSMAPELKGQKFISPWFTMDAHISEMFEEATYLDQNPHAYDGRAGYGEGLVEGYHLLGMIDHLCNHAIWCERDWIAWNYGLDSVRFTSVIRVSDYFRLSGTVKDVITRPDGRHLLVLDIVAQVKGREKPGFVAVQRILWGST